MFLIRFALGFLLVLIGLGYVLDAKQILRINAFMRDRLFKDSFVLLKGKKIGSWLILIGFVLIALGYVTPLP